MSGADLNLSVNVGAEELGLREVKLSIPRSLYNRQLDRSLQSATQFVRLDGFRPGKAPKAMVQKLYGAQIKQELLEKILREGLETAKTQENLKPVRIVKVDSAALNEQILTEGDTPLEMLVSVAVIPEPKIEKYEGLSFEAKVYPRNQKVENFVEDAIQNMIWPHQPLKPVEGRDVAQDGDRVTLTYFGSDKEGNFTVERGPVTFTLGKGKRIEKRIHDLVRGMKLGERRQHIAENPAAENAAEGSEAAAPRVLGEFALDSISEEVPFELNDEFIKVHTLGESLAELRKKIDDGIESTRAKVNKDYRTDALIGALVEANPFTLHDAVVEEELRQDLYQKGLLDPKDPRTADFDLMAMDFLKDEVAKVERKVRLTVILKQLVEQLGIEPTEEKYEEFFQGLVSDGDFKSIEEAKRALDFPRDKSRARFFVAQDELIEKLLAASTITEVEVVDNDEGDNGILNPF